VVQDQAALRVVRVLIEVVQPLGVEGAGPPDQAVGRLAGTVSGEDTVAPNGRRLNSGLGNWR